MVVKAGSVFLDSKFKQCDIRITNGFVMEIGEKLYPATDEAVYNADGCYVIPGLFDTHMHGAVGEDFSDGSPEGLLRIAEYERSHGITTFCPTTMSLGRDELLKVFKIGKGVAERCSQIFGFHMEGPFINSEKKGAQNEENIVLPDMKLFYDCFEASGGLIKKITLAPEMDGALEMIRNLKDKVCISLGHTNADYSCASIAFSEGAGQVTHLYNGMTEFGHRNPGIIGAAFDKKEVFVELIADGVHVHDSMIRTAFSMFDDRVVLVSDSMRATGLNDGEYSLGGQAVKVNGKKAMLSDGAMAGSVTNLFECMKYCIDIGVPAEKAVTAATLTPARALGAAKQIGVIEVGHRADLVITDDKFRLRKVL